MNGQIGQLETVLKALADGTRLRILGLLTAGEVCVCDIHDSLKISQPKASRHLAYLRRAGLVATRRDGLWVHYKLAPAVDPLVATIQQAVTHALTHTDTVKKDGLRLQKQTGCCVPDGAATPGYACCGPAYPTVVFACVHNAGRSQMAAAFFNALADPARARAISAGTNPGERVHPEVVEVMRESRIELEGTRPQRLTADLAADAQLLVTMGCGDECPYVPGLERDDWPLEDPKGKPLDQVRRIRDEVKARVETLIAARGLRPQAG